jgi:hypothetical protein
LRPARSNSQSNRGWNQQPEALEWNALQVTGAQSLQQFLLTQHASDFASAHDVTPQQHADDGRQQGCQNNEVSVGKAHGTLPHLLERSSHSPTSSAIAISTSGRCRGV